MHNLQGNAHSRPALERRAQNLVPPDRGEKCITKPPSIERPVEQCDDLVPAGWPVGVRQPELLLLGRGAKAGREFFLHLWSPFELSGI